MNFFKGIASNVGGYISKNVQVVKDMIEKETESLKKEQEEMKAQEQEDELIEKILNDDPDKRASGLNSLDQESYDRKVRLPWECRVKNSKENGSSMLDILKSDILKLSENDNNFVMREEELAYEFDFKFDKYLLIAGIMLKIDKKLEEARYRLVPSRVSEDHFWRNYFYKIEDIKRSHGLDNLLIEKADFDMSAFKSPVNAVDPIVVEKIARKDSMGEIQDVKNQLDKELEGMHSNSITSRTGIRFELEQIYGSQRHRALLVAYIVKTRVTPTFQSSIFAGDSSASTSASVSAKVSHNANARQENDKTEYESIRDKHKKGSKAFLNPNQYTDYGAVKQPPKQFNPKLKDEPAEVRKWKEIHGRDTVEKNTTGELIPSNTKWNTVSGDKGASVESGLTPLDREQQEFYSSQIQFGENGGSSPSKKAKKEKFSRDVNADWKDSKHAERRSNVVNGQTTNYEKWKKEQSSTMDDDHARLYREGAKDRKEGLFKNEENEEQRRTDRNYSDLFGKQPRPQTAKDKAVSKAKGGTNLDWKNTAHVKTSEVTLVGDSPSEKRQNDLRASFDHFNTKSTEAQYNKKVEEKRNPVTHQIVEGDKPQDRKKRILSSSLHSEGFYNLVNNKDQPSNQVFDLSLSNLPSDLTESDLKQICGHTQVISVETDRDNIKNVCKGDGRLKIRATAEAATEIKDKLSNLGAGVKDFEKDTHLKSNFSGLSNVKWDDVGIAKEEANTNIQQSPTLMKVKNLSSKGDIFGSTAEGYVNEFTHNVEEDSSGLHRKKEEDMGIHVANAQWSNTVKKLPDFDQDKANQRLAQTQKRNSSGALNVEAKVGTQKRPVTAKVASQKKIAPTAEKTSSTSVKGSGKEGYTPVRSAKTATAKPVTRSSVVKK